jgi:cytochrome c
MRRSSMSRAATALCGEPADHLHFSRSSICGLTQINDDRPRRTIKTRPVADSGTLKKRSAMLRFALRQAIVTLLLTTPALAASPAEQRGKTYALTNCARCHSVDRVTKSPLKIAPPFRTLHLRYPVETLGEALAEGIETGHPTMPAFQLDPDQINDLLSYLKSLE